MQDEVTEGGLRFKVESKYGNKRGPKAEGSRHCGAGGQRDLRSSRRHKQTRGELALWSKARVGSPKIRLR